MTRDLNRGPLALMRWVKGAIDATLPRQAVVDRSGNGGVWIRFAPVDATQPPVWFPSTIADLPPGWSGWVQPLPGGKGLFVASGMPRPYSQAETNALLAAARPIMISNGAFSSASFTTNAVHDITAASTDITGLPVGATYKVKVFVTVVASGATGTGRFGARVVGGGINGHAVPMGYGIPITTKREHSAEWTFERTVGGDGKITVVPVCERSAGTINIEAAYVTVTLS